MKRFIILILAVIIIASCDNNITDINKSPYLAEQVPAGSLFANAQKNTSDNLASTNVNLNIFKLLAQYWTETTYTDEANYDITTRSIPDNWWDAFYTDVIKDLQEAKRLTMEDEDPRVTDEFKRNRIALMNILEVYAWSVLVNTFGDIPYSSSMDIEDLLPTYDDAKDIHMDLVSRLDVAMDNLDGSVGENFVGYDLLYGGNIEAWTRFANSLKLRLGMIIADEDATTAQSIVEEATTGSIISSNNENVSFSYLSATPNTNPLYVSLVLSGRKDFVMANTFIDQLQVLADPRLFVYATDMQKFSYPEDENDVKQDSTFTTDGLVIVYDNVIGEDSLTYASGTVTIYATDADKNPRWFIGGIYGLGNSYTTHAKTGTFSTEATTPQLLVSYSEVQFYLAEAAARGWAVGGTAESFYNEAITASMEYWGIEGGKISTYLAKPEVAYATAVGDFKQKIGIQKWIALNNRGWLAWTEWRRLDAPTLVAPPDAVSDIPVRFTYPVSEQNLNTPNYESAAAAIGGDVVATKLYWDMH